MRPHAPDGARAVPCRTGRRDATKALATGRTGEAIDVYDPHGVVARDRPRGTVELGLLLYAAFAGWIAAAVRRLTTIANPEGWRGTGASANLARTIAI